MVDKLIALLIAPMDGSVPADLEGLLSALEGEPLVAPTHAGADERKRLPYDRASATEQVTSSRIGWLNLWRAKVPKYTEGHLTARGSHNEVRVHYETGLKEEHLPKLFDAWTRLADVLHPEFGFVHLLWRLGTESEPYNRGTKVNPKELRDYGINNVHPRTWFGPDVVDIIGRERLLGLPHAKETEWGGVQLDLVDSPWLANFEALFPRQREIREAFKQWRVLGDYSNVLKLQPGVDWVPPRWKVN